jgi:hypothetical protein
LEEEGFAGGGLGAFGSLLGNAGGPDFVVDEPFADEGVVELQAGGECDFGGAESAGREDDGRGGGVDVVDGSVGCGADGYGVDFVRSGGSVGC